MAVHNAQQANTNTTATIGAQAFQQPVQPQPQTAQPQATAGAPPRMVNPLSFHAGSMFGAPIPKGIGSEYYNKFKDHLTRIFKASNDGVEILLIDLDNNSEPSLAFSSIVVAIRYKAVQNKVAYHVLTLEATGERLTPIMDTVDNVQTEILRTTSYAIDHTLMDKAGERVRRAFPNCDCFSVDATVIPREFNVDEPTAMQQIALNAGLACGTELEIRSPNFADVNLGVMKVDSQLNINVNFAKTQVNDAVGMPMRSDVLISFFSRKKDNNSKYASVNTGDNEVKLTELSAFVDLIWAPVSNNVQNLYAQGPQPTQKYAARMVITNLQSSYAYTTGSTLLAIATAFSMRQDFNWIQAFKPGMNLNEIDLGDIGAINIEANIYGEQKGNNPLGNFGTIIDTKTADFKYPENLYLLITSLVREGLIISLDCPEFGPQSWYLSVFAEASNGNSAAYTAIYEAANTLTNGIFKTKFAHGTPMFIDQGNRVHNGYWKDNNGATRDIRDFDYLAVCNISGERNAQNIREWSDTFLKTNYDQRLRLSARKKMISSMAGEKAVFTGFSQRVTFSAPFLEALAASIMEVGLPVQVTTPLSGQDINNQRGVGDWAANGLMNAGQSFSYVNRNGNNQYQAYQHSFRW